MDPENIDLLGLDRIMKRGTGMIIEEGSASLLLYDTVSGAYFLACDEPSEGMTLLGRHMDRGISLLMTADHETGKRAFEKYGFREKLVCRQAAYYGRPPAAEPDLTVRTADRHDLTLLTENYDLISPEEMEMVIARGSMLLGYRDGNLVGFIGEHLEGSMGLLYIFPEYRRKGYAGMLEQILITKTIAQGYVPFCQIEEDNLHSLALQEKLGLTISGNLICWMWR